MGTSGKRLREVSCFTKVQSSPPLPSPTPGNQSHFSLFFDVPAPGFASFSPPSYRNIGQLSWNMNHFFHEVIHKRIQAWIQRGLTLNIVFGFIGRANSSLVRAVSFNLAYVCSRALWVRRVSYRRKLNFIHVCVTICPYIPRSCV